MLINPVMVPVRTVSRDQDKILLKVLIPSQTSDHCRHETKRLTGVELSFCKARDNLGYR